MVFARNFFHEELGVNFLRKETAQLGERARKVLEQSFPGGWPDRPSEKLDWGGLGRTSGPE